MGIIVGLDIGGSTTKIVGFSGKVMLKPVQIKANQQIASIYGAIGQFLYENQLQLTDLERVMMTGVGSNSISQNIYGIPTYKVDEFVSNGEGGKFFAQEEDIIVVSMGTGTSFVKAQNGELQYLGGIGIGGGTILGLSSLILHTREIPMIEEMARKGNVGTVDLRISDISAVPLPGLPLEVTASNFGKAVEGISKEDAAAGIVHMVLEAICKTVVLTGKGHGIRKFVLIGSLTNFKQLGDVKAMMKMISDVEFLIPKDGEFATAIGASLASEYHKIVTV